MESINLLDCLYPRICPVCREVLWEKDVKVCTRCRGKLMVIEEPLCKRCGKGLEEDEREYCRDCEVSDHEFIAGRGVFKYKNEIKESVYNFKYKNKREFVDFYTDEMVRVLGDWIRYLAPDALIPVPLHPKKERLRGYNQAGLLAHALGDKLDIPVIEDFIVRSQNTPPQKDKTPEGRKKNMKKAFNIGENIVKLDIAMVIDDIYTTGATADAVSRLLKDGGVREVYCLSLCIGNGF